MKKVESEEVHNGVIQMDAIPGKERDAVRVDNNEKRDPLLLL